MVDALFCARLALSPLLADRQTLRERQRERERDRQTHRHTDTDTHTDTHTHTHTDTQIHTHTKVSWQLPHVLSHRSGASMTGASTRSASRCSPTRSS